MLNHQTLAMTASQFDLVYNASSFTLASMMATTIFLWLRVSSVHEKYKSAVVISGLVTFIAAYHYIRIFNSWVEAYSFPASVDGAIGDPVATGVPFNDAYRYMDWLLTVPLLLIEIVLVMKMSPKESAEACRNLGVSSALMIIFGYPGELVLDDLGTRFFYWALGMVPFVYIVYQLLIGLRAAIDAEADPDMKSKVNAACVWTVISWCTYPVVYITPMLGVSGSQAVVYIQLGYCVADVISKCGVGLIIFQISNAKSKDALRDTLVSDFGLSRDMVDSMDKDAVAQMYNSPSVNRKKNMY